MIYWGGDAYSWGSSSYPRLIPMLCNRRLGVRRSDPYGYRAHTPNHRREEGISSRVGASRIVRADRQTDSAYAAESFAYSRHSAVELRGAAVARKTKSELEASMNCQAGRKGRHALPSTSSS